MKRLKVLANIHRLLPVMLVVIVMVLLTSKIGACPYCNNAFYAELLKERGETLAGQELLASIQNQAGLSGNSAGISGQTDIRQAPPNTPQIPHDFVEVIDRDNSLPIPATSYVSQDVKADKEVSIELAEGETYIGRGVIFKGFTINGSIPGPTIIVEEGDVVAFTVVNKGTVPHGASIHAAYTQTSKYLGKIEAGTSKTLKFKVTYPGVYLYHCAPGGHAIPMHIIFGQYGMMVVKPKKQYKLEQVLKKKPDVEMYLLQHEFYSSGKDAIEGKPLYTTFNGKLFKYVEEPIKAKPGDYVRIYFLNAGPNLISTFHIVGIIWDYVYWQGNPDAVWQGGQSVLSGPTDSWVIEFRVPPAEGSYLMLSHAVGSTDRGAIGILACDKNAVTPLTINSDGPKYSESEFSELKSKATRIISPFEPGTPDVDVPQVSGPETKEVTVKIIGNSFYPKVLHITPGTTVKWINEDVFSYMEGEFSGIHNAATYEGPVSFASPLLAHTESFKFKFDKDGEYKYMCAPHPYMKGVVVVGDVTGASTAGTSSWIIIISILSFLLLIVLLYIIMSVRKKYELLTSKRFAS